MWILQIGRTPGRNISITSSVPQAPGPVPGGQVLWGDDAAAYMTMPLVVRFDEGLRSGSFSGTGIDPQAIPEGRFAVSGTFDCRNGGRTLTGTPPWTGR